MKKFKKMLAGLLGAAMVLTSFGTPTWADSATRPILPTIDTTQKGTLTINKYEGTDPDKSKDKPLAGVEFTIWKVADIEQDSSSSSKVGFKYTPVNGLGLVEDDFTSNATYAQEYTDDIYDKVLKKLNTKIKDGTIGKGTKETTVLDESNHIASAKFENLDLGLYLVQETKAPSQIVNKTANFLVSVPMTNEAGTAWNYDVVAEPKNAAVYAGINLVKTGTTIKADGTTETVNLKGVTFALQSRPTGSNDSVTWTNVGSYTTKSDGTINVNDLAPNEYRFIETDLGDNNGYILNGKSYEFTVQDDGKIKVGTKVPAKTATITADNEKPDLKKEVENGNTYENAADASIGDMVEWKVSASVPSNVDQLEKYSITDKMSSALTWVEAEAALNITYKSNGTAVNDIDPAFAETTDYTLIKPADKEDGKSWTITFTDAGKKKLKDNNISSIEVTFKTKLNENANIGSAGNLNDAQLDYSNAIYPLVDPTNPNDGKKPGEDHIKDQAKVYSFAIDMTKVDGNNTATKLEGVHFDLYKYSGTVTEPTESDLKGSGKKINITDLVTDVYGKITVKGLENGNYYLVETKAAAGGYNLLKAPVKVVIAQEYSVEKKTTVTKDAEGNVTSTTTVVNKTFTGGDENNAGTYSVTIENRKGFTLPKTGDIGTAMFLIIGIGGMLAAVYIMLRGRKRA